MILKYRNGKYMMQVCVWIRLTRYNHSKLFAVKVGDSNIVFPIEKKSEYIVFSEYDLQKLHTFFLILKHCEQGGGPTKTSFYCYNKKNSIIG